MDRLFRKVSVKDRNPNFIGHSYRSYFYTDKGIVYYDKYDGWEKSLQVDWWLEKVELPSTEILEALDYNGGFKDGVNWIISKLKGTDTLGKEVKGE